MNQVFANCSDKDEIYPLTVKEIVEAQKKDKAIDKLRKYEKYKMLLIENVHVLCKDGKLVMPKSLQYCAVSWYHHYLQHPGNTCLKETIRTAMFWMGIQRSVQNHVKRCQSCQTNKKQNLRYGKLPVKLVKTTPWEALCVNLIGA